MSRTGCADPDHFGVSAPSSPERPERTCIGCRTKRPQAELLRLVRTTEGDLRIGRTEPGRGAWVCADTTAECVDKAVKRKAFAKALRGQVLPDAINRLRVYGAGRERMDGRGR